MKLIASLVLAGVVAIFAATAVPAQDHADLAADLQQILAEFLAENPAAPGVAAGVMAPRLGLEWQGAAGAVARGSQEPLTPAHTFRIASNTKVYVAAAVLRLVEDGHLRLDAPLGGLLPARLATLLNGDGYDLRAITLRQVLSHTAGLADHTDGDYGERIVAAPQHAWTADAQVRRCVELFDPLGPPGGAYRYSDTGYVLLGAVVEQASGRSLAAAVRELLGFERLGLAATWWEQKEPAPAAAAPRAHQYFGDHDVTGWNASFDLFGGGGLIADVPDLARFLRALLAGEVLREETSLAAMTGGGTFAYRLGLMAMDLDGWFALGHQGFWNTFVFHVPGLDVTVAGTILSHDAANGRLLAERLVARLAAAND